MFCRNDGIAAHLRPSRVRLVAVSFVPSAHPLCRARGGGLAPFLTATRPIHCVRYRTAPYFAFMLLYFMCTFVLFTFDSRSHARSLLTSQPMRLTGHSMTAGTREGGAAGADRFIPSLPPLEHPYGALALVLALSGSQRWASAGEDKGQEVQEGGAGLTVSGDQGREGERSGQGLDTSRLWSTDSEEEEGGGEEGEEGRGDGQHEDLEGDGADGGGLSTAAKGGRRRRRRLSSSPGLKAAAPQDGGESEEGTSEWLKAFESDGSASDGELSPHTDGQYERPPSFVAERANPNPRAHWFTIDWSTTQGNHALICMLFFTKNRFLFFLVGSARILIFRMILVFIVLCQALYYCPA